MYKLKYWLIRVIALIVLTGILLLLVILYPSLVYANRTIYKNYTIFHERTLDKALLPGLDEARQLASKSEFYNSNVKLDVCLNDGSYYPQLIQQLFGRAFAWGFYNKVVLKGNADYSKNFVALDGYKWNLAQLLTHEAIHCYQFKKLGLWKSNPLAKIPEWKWEGYPEYIARSKDDQLNLKRNIKHLLFTEQSDTNGWMLFSDGTGSSIRYYKNWLLVQYCITVKGMTYKQLINDTSDIVTIRNQMMTWYNNKE